MNPPYNTIVATDFTLPTYIFDNGQVTGNPWNNGINMFLVDGDYANSNVNQGTASDITVGGYNFQYNGISIPQGAVITGIELQVIGYRGSQTVPPITLDISLYDNTDGANDFYPYVTGFTGLTETVTTTILGTPTYLFASSFTVDQINNLKMNLQANGDISLDSFLVRVYFYIPAPTPEPVVESGVCIDCESPIQVQAMFLELPFLSGETKFYLKKGSLTYPNGVPVQPGDVGSCGGKVFFVFDEGKKKADGNFEENVTLDTDTGSWTVLPSGVIEVDIADVTNRGLDYKQPATHVSANMSNHDANSKVIISNNTPYNLTLVRSCQADLVFSPPINVEQEDVDVVNPVHTFNFKGNGVVVAQNGTDPYQADITIAGSGTSTPVPDATSSTTSGNVQVPDLTWEHTVAGTDRLLTVQVSMEAGKTVTGITYNGVAMTLGIAVEGADTRSETWYLVAPSLGTHDIVVTFSADSYTSAGAESWSGVDQTTPIGDTSFATGTSLAPSVVVNTLYDNSVVVDGLSTALAPILQTPGAGQIENWHEYANTDTRQGSSSYEPAGSAPDAVTMSYAITQNTEWSITAIEIKGITAVIATLEVEDEGVSVETNVTKLNFIGAGVTATPGLPGEVDVTIPGGAASDEKVGATATDTTPDFLDPKLNIHSSDSSVTVNKTITNPGGNEVVDYDLLVALGGGGGGTKIEIDTTQKVIGGGGSNSYTISIPGGTLGTSNAIRGRVLISAMHVENAEVVSCDIQYGGVSIGSVAFDGGTDEIDATGGYFEFLIVADNATNAQKVVATALSYSDGTSIKGISSNYDTGAIDSTINQNLEAIVSTGGLSTITIEAIIVEKISSGDVLYSNGVDTQAAATGTQTVTHNLGTIPSSIDIQAVGGALGGKTTSSFGSWDDNGQSCVMQVFDDAAPSIVSNNNATKAVDVSNAGGSMSGTIGNVTSTTFDIVWVGGATGVEFHWKASA